MEGPRPPFDHELPDLIQFLSKNLRPQQQSWSIAEEYPLAIHDANLNNVRMIKADDQILSAAVMKPIVIKSPVGLFKVAAIGSVVTSPNHRNQGFSKQVLDECLAAGQSHGCDFAILWTNLFDFYRKLGFELGGTEIAIHIPQTFRAENPEGLKMLESAKIDPDAILKLYNKHTAGSLRTTDDVRRFLQIPNSRVFTAWDKTGKLQAYLVEGKGADLDAHIHEWGGGISKLLPLIQFAIETEKRDLNLLAPAHSTNLLRRLKEMGLKQHSGVLGMIKVLNAPHLLMKIKKYVRSMGVQDLVLEPRDGRFYFGYKEQIFSTDTETDLVRVMFGPLKPSALNVFDPVTAEVFDDVFPIPLWIWGWDSV